MWEAGDVSISLKLISSQKNKILTVLLNNKVFKLNKNPFNYLKAHICDFSFS